VIALFQSYKIAGVLSLMIVLLLIQILAVWAWGGEPRAQPLEALDAPAVAR
jgi:putative MFS transporter